MSNTSMSNLSFDIKNTEDFFRKLCEEYEEFERNKTSSRIALNCAMTAWHLTDWIYNEYGNQLKVNFKSIHEFRNDLKVKCSSLQVMQDLTNGTKHHTITMYISKVKDTNLHKGDYSSDYSRDFNISTLDIKLIDGTSVYFEDEIENVMNFWRGYLNTKLNLTV